MPKSEFPKPNPRENPFESEQAPEIARPRQSERYIRQTSRRAPYRGPSGPRRRGQ